MNLIFPSRKLSKTTSLPLLSDTSSKKAFGSNGDSGDYEQSSQRAPIKALPSKSATTPTPDTESSTLSMESLPASPDIPNFEIVDSLSAALDDIIDAYSSFQNMNRRISRENGDSSTDRLLHGKRMKRLGQPPLSTRRQSSLDALTTKEQLRISSDIVRASLSQLRTIEEPLVAFPLNSQRNIVSAAASLSSSLNGLGASKTLADCLNERFFENSDKEASEDLGIMEIRNSHDKKMLCLMEAEELLNASIDQARFEDDRKEQQDLKDYGNLYQLTGLPPVFAPIKIKADNLERYGLLKLPDTSDLEESDSLAKFPLTSYPSLYQLEECHATRVTNYMNAQPWRPAPINDTKNDYLESQLSSMLDKPKAKKTNLGIVAGSEITKGSHRQGHLQSPQEKELVDSLEKSVVLIPPSILFTDYVPNKTYRQTLLVKNRLKHSQRFKVSTKIPGSGASAFFAIKLVHAPLSSDGTVAPGMCCRYNIYFRPNSFANYHHNLHVTSASGDSFLVKLSAERDGPILNLPAVLECGTIQCGIAGTLVWNVVNSGGDGRFYILDDDVPECEDIYSRFTSNDGLPQREFGTIGPFQVYPYTFALKRHESMQLVVRYNQISNVSDTSQLRLACDNNQTYKYELKGLSQIADVSITVVDLEGHEPSTKSTDKLFQQMLDFGRQEPACGTRAKIVVQNNTSLALHYNWVVFDYPGRRTYDQSHVGSHDESSCFTLDPTSGTLDPNGQQTFNITFTPQKARSYEVSAEFRHHEIPTTLPAPILPADFRLCRVHHPGQDTLLRVKMSGQGVHPAITLSPAIISIPTEVDIGSTHTSTIYLTSTSNSAHKVSLYAEGFDTSVAAISLAYDTTTNTTIHPHSSLRLTLLVEGLFEGLIEGRIVCEISPGYSLSVAVHGTVKIWMSGLAFAAPALAFGVVALGHPKCVEVPLVNRSRLPMQWRITGHAVERHPSGTLMDTMDPTSEYGHVLIRQPHSLVFSDTLTGTLAPDSRTSVCFTYIPTWYQELGGVVECQVYDDDSGHHYLATSISLTGCARTPSVTIGRSDDCSPIQCYTGVKKVWALQLVNHLDLVSRIKWTARTSRLLDTDLGDDDITVRILPHPHFILQSFEVREFEIELTCARAGRVNLEVYCGVEGMVVQTTDKCGIKLEIQACGLSVDIQITDPGREVADTCEIRSSNFWSSCGTPAHKHPSACLNVDFGVLDLFDVGKRVLKITNTSGVSSDFVIGPKVYGTRSVVTGAASLHNQQDTDRNNTVFSTHARENMLSLPLDTPGFTSHHGKMYMSHMTKTRHRTSHIHALLAGKRGVGFLAVPATGQLGPWEQVDVDIICYNNLPKRRYTDTLGIVFGGAAAAAGVSVEVPMCVWVRGIPLCISGSQVGRASPGDERVGDGSSGIDRLEFGTRLVNEPAYKSFKIENQSPVHVNLDFRLVGSNNDNNNNNGVFTIIPRVLELDAFGWSTVKIKFAAAAMGLFEEIVESSISFLHDGVERTLEHSLLRISGRTTRPKLDIVDGDADDDTISTLEEAGRGCSG